MGKPFGSGETPLPVDTFNQLKYLNSTVTAHFPAVARQADKLCVLMRCPIDDKGNSINCNKCIGSIRMDVLRTIEPEITRENITQVIQIYEVLVK